MTRQKVRFLPSAFSQKSTVSVISVFVVFFLMETSVRGAQTRTPKTRLRHRWQTLQSPYDIFFSFLESRTSTLSCQSTRLLFCRPSLNSMQRMQIICRGSPAIVWLDRRTPPLVAHSRRKHLTSLVLRATQWTVLILAQEPTEGFSLISSTPGTSLVMYCHPHKSHFALEIWLISCAILRRIDIYSRDVFAALPLNFEFCRCFYGDYAIQLKKDASRL